MNWWLSWYHGKQYGEFELNSPWWMSGTRMNDEAITLCAAIKAKTEDNAKQIIFDAYDVCPDSIEFRFIEQRADDWSPFCDRFPKADWMRWEQE